MTFWEVKSVLGSKYPDSVRYCQHIVQQQPHHKNLCQLDIDQVDADGAAQKL